MKAAAAIGLCLLLALVVFAQSGQAQCTYTNVTGCHISTAPLEVNLGVLPLDHYNDMNNGSYLANSNSTWNNCPTTSTVRQCVQAYLAGYAQEGATGVRFSFGLGGGAYSTPFDSSGNVRSDWASNLGEFLDDVYSAGIYNITPMPAMGLWGGDGSSDQGPDTPQISTGWAWDCQISGYVNTSGTSVSWVSGSQFVTGDLNMDPVSEFVANINGTGYAISSVGSATSLTLTSSAGSQTDVPWGPGEQLIWVPWLPYGLTADTYGPDCQEDNNGYSDAARNDSTNNSTSSSQFWGWTPFNNLVLTIADAASTVGLNIEEFDIYNELDLVDFLSTLHVVFDWDFDSDSWGGIPMEATQDILNYFNPGSGGGATYSSTVNMPSTDGYDCGSVYGDSAMILHESELQAGINGGLIGIPSSLDGTDNLPCSGSTSGMYSAPNISLPQPTISDFHAYLCVDQAPRSDPDDEDVNVNRCLLPDVDTGLGLGDDFGSKTSRTFYNEVWDYLSYREITSNKVMIGETNWMQNPNATVGGEDCYIHSGFPFDNTMAYSNVNGFNGYDDGTSTSSTLYQNALSQVVFRVWENETDPCYVMPGENSATYLDQSGSLSGSVGPYTP